MWVRRATRAGLPDLSVFRATQEIGEGVALVNDPLNRKSLKDLVPSQCRGIADRGYQGEPNFLSLPNSHDEPGLRKFKGRVRSRQETFNGRIKFFECLSGTFRHGIDKHQIVMDAVCLICQYQMDSGSPLFEV